MKKILKVLLISDMHGNLDIINETARAVSADMVIHAADFAKDVYAGLEVDAGKFSLQTVSKGITFI